MKESIDFFIDSYEKAMAEVETKQPHIVIISGEEVWKTANQMKYDRQKG